MYMQVQLKLCNIKKLPKYFHISGNRYLNEKRSLIVSLSNEKISHLTTIRQQIGQFIYTLQEFYSNTNWIEIDGSVFETLGKIKNIVIETS